MICRAAKTCHRRATCSHARHHADCGPDCWPDGEYCPGCSRGPDDAAPTDVWTRKPRFEGANRLGREIELNEVRRRQDT